MKKEIAEIEKEAKVVKDVFLDKAASIGFETTKQGRQSTKNDKNARVSESESESSDEQEEVW